MNETREQELLQALADVCVEGNYKKGKELAEIAMSEGLEPNKAILDGLTVGMGRIGKLFERKEAFVPEMLLAAKVMDQAIEVIKPHFTKPMDSRGTVVIGTVKGDIHDVGKRLVALMLRNLGFTVHDIGVNVAPEAFVAKAVETNADFICMSALMTTTMQGMVTSVEFFRQKGLREKLKIMVGGAPVTPQFAGMTGADGTAPDAFAAVNKAKELALVLAKEREAAKEKELATAPASA
jgi:5-methyltetrahydrofolate--homocysteine methyltransferase